MTAEPAVTISRTLNAPIDAVFAAWTDPALMSQWLFPQENWTAAVENDFVVGGHYRIVITDDKGEPTVLSGVYREIERPTRLVFTWNAHAIMDTIVTLDLRDLGGRTELTLTHTGLVEAATREMTVFGWTGCLTNLERFLAQSPA